MLALEDQEIYKRDWIGLKELNERGDLIRETLPGLHVELNAGMVTSCVKKYFDPSK